MMWRGLVLYIDIIGITIVISSLSLFGLGVFTLILMMLDESEHRVSIVGEEQH